MPHELLNDLRLKTLLPHTKTRASPKYPVTGCPHKYPPGQLAPGPFKPDSPGNLSNPNTFHTDLTQN